MSTRSALCNGCLYFHAPGALTSVTLHDVHTPPTCDAFPAGIPAEIFDGSIDHRQSYLGDNGLQFVEKIPGTSAAYDAARKSKRSR